MNPFLSGELRTPKLTESVLARHAFCDKIGQKIWPNLSNSLRTCWPGTFTTIEKYSAKGTAREKEMESPRKTMHYASYESSRLNDHNLDPALRCGDHMETRTMTKKDNLSFKSSRVSAIELRPSMNARAICRGVAIHFFCECAYYSFK